MAMQNASTRENKEKKGKQTTQTILRILLLAGTAISMFFVPWPILTAWIAPLPETVQEQVKATIDYGFDGVIVYVDQAGREPKIFAAGRKNRETQEPANPHDLFKIASIGKLYDAVMVAKLMHAGILSPDSTLARYLPDVADQIPNARDITLRMLVQHRSGLPNFTDAPNFWNQPTQSRDEAVDLFLDFVKEQPAHFAPDERYEYSNTNYLLLAHIVANVTGEEPFEAIRTLILEPLGLQNTYGSIHDVNPEDVMSGYYVGVEEDLKEVNYGSMLATAQDVGIFLRALNDGSLFAEGERDLYASLYKFEHTGLIPGYQSLARYEKEIDAVVVHFTNTTDFEGYEWNLAEVSCGRIVKILKKGAG